MPTPTTEERSAQYANAWRLQGHIVRIPLVRALLDQMLHTFPEAWFPWVMVLNKLLRALGSPRKLDHWDDIIGYATLVVDHLKEHDK